MSGRTQTKPQPDPPPPPAVLDLNPKQPVVRNVTQTTVERFQKVEEPEANAAATAQPPPLENAPEEVTDTLDVIRELLAQVENDVSEWVLSVFRLPNYAKDGRIGTRGTTRLYLDKLPVSLDYLDVLKEMFGGGAYQIFLLSPKRVIKARWVEHIEGPPRELFQPVAPPAAIALPTAINGSALTPLTQMDQMVQFVSMFKQLRDMMLETMPQPVVNPQPAAIVPAAVIPSEPNPEFDMLMALLNSGTPQAGKLAEKIIDRLFPGGGDSMGGLLREFVTPFMPAITQGVAQYVASQTKPGVTPRGNAQPGASPNPAQTAQPTTVMPDGTYTVTDPPNDDPPEEAMVDEPYLDLIENLVLLMGVAVHQPQTFEPNVERAVTEVHTFQDQYADFAPWIDSLLTMPPAGVLTSMVMLIPDGAPLRENQSALRFVARLQEELTRAKIAPQPQPEEKTSEPTNSTSES